MNLVIGVETMYSTCTNHCKPLSLQVAVSFAMECLFKSVSSVKVWGKLFPSLPLSSYLILKELSGKEKLPSDLPFHELFSTLTKIVGRGSPEERTLAQVWSIVP